MEVYIFYLLCKSMKSSVVQKYHQTMNITSYNIMYCIIGYTKITLTNNKYIYIEFNINHSCYRTDMKGGGDI